MNDTPDSATPFSVLVVCTANQCRSPMAEYLLRGALQSVGVRWSVTSAGTHAVDGSPMDRSAEAVLDRRGHNISGWRSRRLEAELIEAADVILTAEALHRSHVVTMLPAALPRTFTLVQFGRIARHVDVFGDPAGPDSGAELLERVLVARAHVQPGVPGDDDIVDPIGRRMRAFRACAEAIDAAVADMLTPLTVQPAPS